MKTIHQTLITRDDITLALQAAVAKQSMGVWQ